MPDAPAPRPCPCRSGASFAECCRPYLRGTAQAPTALALMRSRYAAFCEGDTAYLLLTRHGAARDPAERRDLERTVAGTRWQNLLVVETHRGGPDDGDGIVRFVAAFRTAPGPLPMAMSGGDADLHQMHERSRFEREGGLWRYVDGDTLPPLRQKRNDPCWCGGGRKSKECHGRR